MSLLDTASALIGDQLYRSLIDEFEAADEADDEAGRQAAVIKIEHRAAELSGKPLATEPRS